MQQFKSRLTRLKNLLQTELPEPLPAIEGYEGITKTLLIKMCENIHAMSDAIETQAETVESVERAALIRFAVQTHESIKDTLEGGLANRPDKKLPSIIDALSQIYERTKLAYFILVKQQLRDEQEIATNRAILEELQGQHEALAAEVNALNEQIASAKSSDEAFKNILAHAEETDRAAEMRVQASEAMFSGIEVVYGKIDGWDEVATAAVEGVKIADGQILQKVGELETLRAAFGQHKEAMDRQVQDADDIVDRIKRLNEEAQQTLGDANRASLAGSFQDRKIAAESDLKSFRNLFLAAIVAFTIATLLLFHHAIVGNTVLPFTVTEMIIRISVLSPFIWLAWFAAEQFSRANRVREDYTYKYASAMAYEGFKKAVEDRDPDLADALLAVAISNLAENPVRLYDKAQQDHSTPASQALDKVLGKFKFKNARIKTPLGDIEANTDEQSKS